MLHRDVGQPILLGLLEQADDARVGQPLAERGLLAEAGEGRVALGGDEQLLAQALQRHRSPGRRVRGAVDDARGAVPRDLVDPVAPEHAAQGQGQRDTS